MSDILADNYNRSIKDNKRSRIASLDYLRVFAILSISSNHALHRSFSVKEGIYDGLCSIPVWVSAIRALLYTFSRIGVPLFLMISGALLLDRDYSDRSALNRFVKHNWLELLRTTEIWLVIMYWYLSFSSSSTLRKEGILKAFVECMGTLLFINQKTMGSMWYMPMILGLYLMIPVMSLALKKLGSKYVFCMTALVAFGGIVVPSINSVLNAAGTDKTISFAVTYSYVFSRYLVFVLAGYWISHGALKKLSNIAVVILTAICFLLTAAFQFWTYTMDLDFSLNYSDIGILVIAVFVFELIQRLLTHRNATIEYIAKISFGIYFLHICIMEGLNAVLRSVPSIQYLVKYLILELASVGGAIVIISATVGIGFVRKYVYLIKE